MPATRIIVDMQPTFSASSKPDVLVGVTKEIMDGVRERSPIIFVEYSYHNSTYPSLMRLVEGYRLVARVTKHEDDGSAVVMRTLRRRSFSHRTLRVCGVNTDMCVLSTVLGLSKKLPESKIIVPRWAVATTTDSSVYWQKFEGKPNLKVVI